MNNLYPHPDLQHLEVLETIVQEGHSKGDRTGTGAVSVFGQFMRFSLRGGRLAFITTKQLYHRPMIRETLWFISGSTNIRYLKEHNVDIWDSWVIPATAEYRELTFDERYERYLAQNARVQEEYRKAIAECPGEPLLQVYPPVGPLSQEHVSEELLDSLSIQRRVLIAGEIGKGAYGAQWRRREDVRLVGEEEVNAYKARGYTDVGRLETGVDGRGGCNTRAMRRYIDQLANAIDLLRTNPDSRRIIVDAWNPGLVDETPLPPCHTLFQFWTRSLSPEERLNAPGGNPFDRRDLVVQQGLTEIPDCQERETKIHAFLDELGLPRRALSCMLYQRSADVPVGVPFNIAQYSLLTHMVAQVTGMIAEDFIWVGGDTHIYQNQMELVDKQLGRSPYLETIARVELNPNVREIDDFCYEDISIVGYDEYHPPIKYPVAV